VQTTDFIKEHLMQLLTSKVSGMKQRMAVSLAHLLLADDIAKAYSSYGGSDVLLDMACDVDGSAARPQEWAQAIDALQQVVKICQDREQSQSLSFVPAPPDDKVCAAALHLGQGRQHACGRLSLVCQPES
jgi:hypothetical protein